MSYPISNDIRIHKIIRVLQSKGWLQEYVFFSQVIAEIDHCKDYEQIEAWLKNKSTTFLKSWMVKYEKFSKTDKKFDSIKHDNNWLALDAAICYL